VKVKVAGVDVTPYVVLASLTVSLRANERSTAAFSMLPGHTCNPLDSVEIYELNGTTRKFHGVVFPGPATQAAAHPANVPYFTNVECVDLWGYLDWAYWEKTYTSNFTVEDLVTDAVTDVLGDFGLSVDGSQDTGGTFTATDSEPVAIAGPVSQILRTYADACSPPRVIRLHPVTDAIRMMVPGADTAPITIDNANPNCISFEWKYMDFTPANRVVLKCGQPGECEITRTFTANGTDTSWPVETTIARLPGTPTPDAPDPRISISINGADPTWVGVEGSANPDNNGVFNIDYSTTPNSLVVGTYGTPTAGTTLALTFAVQGPFSVARSVSETPAPLPLTQVFALTDQYPNLETYLAYAQGQLDKLTNAAREVTAMQQGDPGTSGQSLLPAQKVASVVLDGRDFSNDMVIKELTFQMTEGQMVSDRFVPATKGPSWQTTIIANETTHKTDTVAQQVRDLLKGLTISTSVVAASPTTSSSSTSPSVGVTISTLHLGGSDTEVITKATWDDPPAPVATVGPYPDDPLSPDAVRVPNAVVFERDNVNGAPFPIIQFLPFSFEIESNQTGYVKIGIVDLDSDYGHPIYVHSYTVQVTASSPVAAEVPRGGTFIPYRGNYQLQDDHRYVAMFEGAHIGSPADTGIDGADILIRSVYTLVWLGLTSAQLVSEDEAVIFLPEPTASDADPAAFVDFTGADAGEPASPPTGGYDIIQLPSGKIGTIGGGSFSQPNFNDTGVGTFNSDFTVDNDDAGYNAPPGDAIHGIGRDDAGHFYGIGQDVPSGFIRLFQYNASGPVANWATALAAPSHTRGSVAVNADGTTAYYTVYDGGAGASVRKKVYAYNLAGSTDMGVFIDHTADSYTTPGDHCTPIIVMPNGDLISVWNRNTMPYGLLERYNASGSLQLSYTMYGSNPTPVNLANMILSDYSIDPDTFWCSQTDDDTAGDQMRFVQYDTSTGSVIRQFVVTNAVGAISLPFAIVRQSW